MRVCVLIMSTEKEPSLSNVEAMRETFIKYARERAAEGKLKNEYDFYAYTCSEDGRDGGIKELGDMSLIRVSGTESVYHTFEKTYRALSAFNDVFDWFVRINISTFLNIKLLDNVINKMEKRFVYSNAINAIASLDSEYCNHLYPRGDLMIFSNEVRDAILKQGKSIMNGEYIAVTHVDDVLIGVCLCREYGEEYYEMLKPLKYNFMPEPESHASIDRNAIGSRVKTLPPGVEYSGYSWDDNEYRRCDGKKMKVLDNFVRKYASYSSDTRLEDVMQKEDSGRKITLIQPVNLSFSEVKTYLRGRKKGR